MLVDVQLTEIGHKTCQEVLWYVKSVVFPKVTGQTCILLVIVMACDP